MQRIVLVTGATGYIGGQLVPALLDADWKVRVLVRSRAKLPSTWRDRVEIVEGDAAAREVLDQALAGAEVAYYLLHSMDGRGGYVDRDQRLAETFAAASLAAGVRRIVYLGGLHPVDGPLSEHLGSRVEVGDILLRSGVPTAVLQAGVVLGEGSASFRMLRHLTERLPIAVGPRWLTNKIQPIAVDDVVFYLVKAADLPADVNRTIDLGMEETLTYVEMMKRYAAVTGLRPRRMGVIPVLTPGLASHWVGLVTPVPAGVARPLVGSIIHDAVKHEHDAEGLLGTPEGGPCDYDDAIRRATAGVDPKRWGRTAIAVGSGVAVAAALGSVLTTPGSAWYQGLRKPRWQPPATAFPVVWTGLYALIWAGSTATICELAEGGPGRRSEHYSIALTANLILNVAWSGVFFRAHGLRTAAASAGLLALSSADLVRRAARTRTANTAALVPYALWTAFATALSAEVARLNADASTGSN